MAPSHAFAERAAARPARSSAQTVQRCPGRNGSDHACGCHAPASVQTVLSDGGSPLPPSVREQFEQHLGLDLSGVRVHDSQQAVTAARSVDARAFTVGNHIVFDAGEYRPSSSDGRRVLAHELVHVAQQSGAPEAAELLVGPANDSLELEADRLAGQPGAPTGRASAQQVSRIPGWRTIKEAAYSALIAGLRAARRTGISGLRALVGRLPAALQGFANAEIDIVDVVADILIGLVLAVVGIVVGFGEGIAGLVLGLIRLVGGVLGGLYAAAADILTGSSHRTAEWWASFIQTIRAIPAGLRALITNWLTEFQRASPERAGLMIGELTGQILAIIATFAVAASRAGTVGTVAAEGEAAVSTAARGAPALTLIEGGGQSAATAAAPATVARGSAALQLAPDVAAAARPALRLVPPPAPAAVAVAAPVTAPVAAAGTGAQAAQVGAVAAGQATRAAQAAREERDRQRADRCQRRFPQATPIRWPLPLWAHGASPVVPSADPGARHGRFNLPEEALLVKRGSTFYDASKPEIGRYRRIMQGPPFNRTWPSGSPVHHKWPAYLGGPGDAEKAEGQYDASGRTILAPNLVIVQEAIHRHWHHLLEDQPQGPRPGAGPKGTTPDGAQFCVMDLMG